MAELNARDTKLVQYLNEALTKEKQLEQALQAHIEMTTLAPYRKRLQQHLSETKRHAREVERRIKKLGGTSDGISGVVQDAAGVVQDVAAKGAALAQGPIHMVRGTSEQEVLLKNARTEFKEEAEEIAHYTTIQNLAQTVGDKDTARAREGDPARGEAHGRLPREADPAAHEVGRAGRDPGARAQRRPPARRPRAAPRPRKRTTRGRAARGTKRTAKRATRARSGSAKKARRGRASAASTAARARPPQRARSTSSARKTDAAARPRAARRRAPHDRAQLPLAAALQPVHR